MRNFWLLFLFIPFFYHNSYGQDSIVVYQQNSSLFSNSYTFYANGTFKHYYTTDDLQTWFGQGTYKDSGRKRILRFSDPDFSLKSDFGIIHYEANFERMLKISGKQFISKDYYHTDKRRKVVFTEKSK